MVAESWRDLYLCLPAFRESRIGWGRTIASTSCTILPCQRVQNVHSSVDGGVVYGHFGQYEDNKKVRYEYIYDSDLDEKQRVTRPRGLHMFVVYKAILGVMLTS